MSAMEILAHFGDPSEGFSMIRDGSSRMSVHRDCFDSLTVDRVE